MQYITFLVFCRRWNKIRTGMWSLMGTVSLYKDIILGEPLKMIATFSLHVVEIHFLLASSFLFWVNFCPLPMVFSFMDGQICFKYSISLIKLLMFHQKIYYLLWNVNWTGYFEFYKLICSLYWMEFASYMDSFPHKDIVHKFEMLKVPDGPNEIDYSPVSVWGTVKSLDIILLRINFDFFWHFDM